VLALVAARCDDHRAIRRGVKCLLAKQTPAGDWPQESIAGVFNRSCAITYSNYRNSFSIWALAAYKRYLEERDASGIQEDQLDEEHDFDEKMDDLTAHADASGGDVDDEGDERNGRRRSPTPRRRNTTSNEA
jgi:hypothetical protein